MKNVIFCSFKAVVLITVVVFAFSGCEKEESTPVTAQVELRDVAPLELAFLSNDTAVWANVEASFRNTLPEQVELRGKIGCYAAEKGLFGGITGPVNCTLRAFPDVTPRGNWVATGQAVFQAYRADGVKISPFKALGIGWAMHYGLPNGDDYMTIAANVAFCDALAAPAYNWVCYYIPVAQGEQGKNLQNPPRRRV